MVPVVGHRAHLDFGLVLLPERVVADLDGVADQVILRARGGVSHLLRLGVVIPEDEAHVRSGALQDGQAGQVRGNDLVAVLCLYLKGCEDAAELAALLFVTDISAVVFPAHQRDGGAGAVAHDDAAGALQLGIIREDDLFDFPGILRGHRELGMIGSRTLRFLPVHGTRHGSVNVAVQAQRELRPADAVAVLEDRLGLVLFLFLFVIHHGGAVRGSGVTVQLKAEHVHLSPGGHGCTGLDQRTAVVVQHAYGHRAGGLEVAAVLSLAVAGGLEFSAHGHDRALRQIPGHGIHIAALLVLGHDVAPGDGLSVFLYPVGDDQRVLCELVLQRISGRALGDAGIRHEQKLLSRVDDPDTLPVVVAQPRDHRSVLHGRKPQRILRVVLAGIIAVQRLVLLGVAARGVLGVVDQVVDTTDPLNAAVVLLLVPLLPVGIIVISAVGLTPVDHEHLDVGTGHLETGGVPVCAGFIQAGNVYIGIAALARLQVAVVDLFHLAARLGIGVDRNGAVVQHGDGGAALRVVFRVVLNQFDLVILGEEFLQLLLEFLAVLYELFILAQPGRLPPVEVFRDFVDDGLAEVLHEALEGLL